MATPTIFPPLLPCPFCGGAPEQDTDDPRIIMCDECGLRMAGEYCVEKQIRVWNRRVPIDDEAVMYHALMAGRLDPLPFINPPLLHQLLVSGAAPDPAAAADTASEAPLEEAD